MMLIHSIVLLAHNDNARYIIVIGKEYLTLFRPCYYWVTLLILATIAPSCDIDWKDARLRASEDIPTRDNIHRYQCDNHFIFIVINILSDFSDNSYFLKCIFMEKIILDFAFLDDMFSHDVMNV